MVQPGDGDHTLKTLAVSIFSITEPLLFQQHALPPPFLTIGLGSHRIRTPAGAVDPSTHVIHFDLLVRLPLQNDVSPREQVLHVALEDSKGILAQASVEVMKLITVQAASAAATEVALSPSGRMVIHLEVLNRACGSPSVQRICFDNPSPRQDSARLLPVLSGGGSPFSPPAFSPGFVGFEAPGRPMISTVYSSTPSSYAASRRLIAGAIPEDFSELMCSGRPVRHHCRTSSSQATRRTIVQNRCSPLASSVLEAAFRDSGVASTLNGNRRGVSHTEDYSSARSVQRSHIFGRVSGDDSGPGMNRGELKGLKIAPPLHTALARVFQATEAGKERNLPLEMTFNGSDILARALLICLRAYAARSGPALIHVSCNIIGERRVMAAPVLVETEGTGGEATFFVLPIPAFNDVLRITLSLSTPSGDPYEESTLSIASPVGIQAPPIAGTVATLKCLKTAGIHLVMALAPEAQATSSSFRLSCENFQNLCVEECGGEAIPKEPQRDWTRMTVTVIKLHEDLFEMPMRIGTEFTRDIYLKASLGGSSALRTKVVDWRTAAACDHFRVPCFEFDLSSENVFKLSITSAEPNSRTVFASCRIALSALTALNKPGFKGTIPLQYTGGGGRAGHLTLSIHFSNAPKVDQRGLKREVAGLERTVAPQKAPISWTDLTQDVQTIQVQIDGIRSKNFDALKVPFFLRLSIGPFKAKSPRTVVPQDFNPDGEALFDLKQTLSLSVAEEGVRALLDQKPFIICVYTRGSEDSKAHTAHQYNKIPSSYFQDSPRFWSGELVMASAPESVNSHPLTLLCQISLL